MKIGTTQKLLAKTVKFLILNTIILNYILLKEQQKILCFVAQKWHLIHVHIWILQIYAGKGRVKKYGLI